MKSSRITIAIASGLELFATFIPPTSILQIILGFTMAFLAILYWREEQENELLLGGIKELIEENEELRSPIAADLAAIHEHLKSQTGEDSK